MIVNAKEMRKIQKQMDKKEMSLRLKVLDKALSPEVKAWASDMQEAFDKGRKEGQVFELEKLRFSLQDRGRQIVKLGDAVKLRECEACLAMVEGRLKEVLVCSSCLIKGAVK